MPEETLFLLSLATITRVADGMGWDGMGSLPYFSHVPVFDAPVSSTPLGRLVGEHVTVGADGASKATQPHNPTQGYVFFCDWQAWQASSYARSARLRAQRQQSIPGLCVPYT
ncbi:hypothetical protein BDP55DRAFT_303200 [Colletotrichum godetiae]|uniref:Uncharacterized protein n=1 Tax=Colletotrichum godetiae TaxID=1209918 RepID=A0AAJ0EY66_9PEZI|nr:uncharacterized protein BDP55DRAFT_303200 [Colletotrichum godetiae]KAK1690685.1 hypothetical protein BDP55DRAFT_303200 [Colletotrichum godetiae]